MMHRVASHLHRVSKTSTLGFHTSAASSAISRFNLPAMSPTMTEGTILKWTKSEGDSFTAGEVLLELETDKAQIDVEAAEDGVLAKIVLKDGSKAPVNTLIALLAEEGDDISNVEVPAEENTPVASQPEKEEPKKDAAPSPATPSTPISHHDVDTSKLKKPLSPAVLSLVLKHGIKDIDSVKASGNGGRILKGDVLAHLGLIKPKPAPKATLSVAPPRDQIVFAQSKKSLTTKEEKKVLDTFIAKDVVIDNLLGLRHTLNEQNGSRVSVNDFIAKAAERALKDVVSNQKMNITMAKPIVYKTDIPAFSEKYTGGQFKVFHLAEPTYDFITDSYSTSKPYVLHVDKTKVITSNNVKTNKDNEMLDLITYLGGEKPIQQERRITLTSEKLDFTKKDRHSVQVKLEAGSSKILNDPKAALFLSQVEHYIQNPAELV